MKFLKQHNLWMSALAVTCLCSCGSDDSDNSAGIDASGSPIASQGTIDGFGSVIINDIRFDSSKAIILINEQSATEDNLRVGYQITVTGNINKNNVGIANKIEYFPELIGDITEIDLDANQIIVLGRRIHINYRTLMANNIVPNDIRGLNIGDKVQVSGQLNARQLLVATRIELTNDLFQLNGVITTLDLANQRFNLQDTLVNYAGANFVKIDQLANNMRVSVRGTQDANGNIQAQQIFNIKTEFDSKIEKIEIEGNITRFVSATDFDVNGHTCTTRTQTLYEHGSSTNLMLHAEIEIKGSVNSSGKLIADKIQFEMEDEDHIEGQVSAINLLSTHSIVTGNLTIGNSLIKTTSATRYEDKGETHFRRFNLASILIGDNLDVTGYNHNNEFIATKIERKEF